MLSFNCSNIFFGFIILLTISNIYGLQGINADETTLTDDYIKTSFDPHPLMVTQLVTGRKLEYLQSIIKDLTKFLNTVLSFLQGIFGLKDNIFTNRSILDPKNAEFLLQVKTDAKELWTKILGITNLIEYNFKSWLNFLLDLPGLKQISTISNDALNFLNRFPITNSLFNYGSPSSLPELLQIGYNKLNVLTPYPKKPTSLFSSPAVGIK